MSEVITDRLDLWTSALFIKSGAGRGNNGKQETYGIKKLRELILELAMRGKLVPQDTNDEPARALLQTIAKDKALLLKAGEVKEEKPQPSIGENEKAFEPPNGWEWVRFGSISQHNSGKTLDRGRNTGRLRDYITTSNLYWGRFDLANVRQMPIADDELERCTARKGDLLICEGGEAGRAAVWPYDHNVCFQNHIHRARFYGEINPYFAYRFLEKLNATGEIDQHRKGVGISNMSSRALASIVVPLPPRAEQHRIVAKLDELMALCDRLEQQQTHSIEAHQTLAETLLATLTRVAFPQEQSEAWARIASHFDTLVSTEQSIDQLKQTILQLAIMGKLASHDPNDEPATELVEKIATKKEQMIKEGKLRRQKSLSHNGDQQPPFRLPENWAWERLGNLTTHISDGTHRTPNYIDKGVPFISVKDLDGSRVSFDNCKYISQEEHAQINSRCNPEFGDLLICRIGTLGRATIVDTERPFSLFVSVGLLKFCQDLFIPRYAHIVLHSPLLVAAYERIKAGGSHTNKLNLEDLPSLVIPVPPLVEQHRIVAKVDELLALCDALKARHHDAQTTQAWLADAIVEQVIA